MALGLVIIARISTNAPWDDVGVDVGDERATTAMEMEKRLNHSFVVVGVTAMDYKTKKPNCDTYKVMIQDLTTNSQTLKYFLCQLP